MADEKVTKMVMKVDLQCYKCYRKIKKVLCSCPKIRDQVFDEKQNTVTITVVCCSPEKIMEKIACKAGDTVESIEILPEKKKETDKPIAEKPVELPKPAGKSTEPEKKKTKEPVVQGFPLPTPTGPVPMYPVGMCCCCHEGGPCYHGYMLLPMRYNGYGLPAYEFPGSNRGYYVNLCDYFNEENLSGCSIM